MAVAEAIDHNVLQGLRESLGGDEEFLVELIQTYFDDSPVQLVAMEVALAAGDAESLRRAAHSLKSNSANFGALKLAATCKEVEEMAKAGVLAGAGEKITQVAAEYGQARVALEAIQGGA
jgi:HPt (histidine-containing phosphotransfer) domain-containing protein